MYLVDPRLGTVLCRLFPLDRARNSDAIRRTLTPLAEMPPTTPAAPIAPLLKKLMADYTSMGLPPAYIPMTPAAKKED